MFGLGHAVANASAQLTGDTGVPRFGCPPPKVALACIDVLLILASWPPLADTNPHRSMRVDDRTAGTVYA
jgi:hypothetical protein